ncbi:hypothetical protein ALPO108162_09505 [Alicyclobacillus pomorum]|jgi:hypothetical protein
MDKYGPLYHRNGAKFWPKPMAKLFIGIVILIGICEFVLGTMSAL